MAGLARSGNPAIGRLPYGHWGSRWPAAAGFRQNTFFTMRVSEALLVVQQALQSQVTNNSAFVHQPTFVNGTPGRGAVRIHLRHGDSSGKNCCLRGIVQVEYSPKAGETILPDKAGEDSLAGLRFNALSAQWRT